MLINFQNVSPSDSAVNANKAVIKDPTTPQTHHYTTLWKVDARKLLTIWNKCLV